MIGQALTAELARNADIFVGCLGLAFVLFDSLTKKADVAGLKRDLELRHRQLLSEVVADLEEAVRPTLGRMSSYTVDEDLRLITLPALDLDDTARDALTKALRDNEEHLALIRMIRRLPKAIHALNKAVFWLIAAAAALALVAAAILTIFTLDTVPRWLLLLIPASVMLAAAVTAAIRQMKVQNAEQQIIDTDSRS